MAQLRITVLEESSLLPPPIELCSYGSQKWVVATLPGLSRGLGDSDTLLYRTSDPQVSRYLMSLISISKLM